MTQGDEWIRALFKKGQVTGNISFDNNILSYSSECWEWFFVSNVLDKESYQKNAEGAIAQDLY